MRTGDVDVKQKVVGDGEVDGEVGGEVNVRSIVLERAAEETKNKHEMA